MKYFIDTEFLEGTQNKTFLGFKYGETKPTIDLISIGLQQELNNKVRQINFITLVANGKGYEKVEETLKRLQEMPEYPKQTNEHNALQDSKFVKDLYYFLKDL